MIATNRDIERILIKNGYTIIGDTQKHARIYVSNSETCKAAIVIEAIQADVIGKYSLNEILRAAEEKYNILLAVEPLIILIGSSKVHKLYGKNMITIDCSDSKVKCNGYSEEYADEYEAFMDFSKKQSAAEKMKSALSGGLNKTYSTWLIYVIILVNLYCFYKAVLAGGIGFAGYVRMKEPLTDYALSARSIFIDKTYIKLLSYMFKHGSVGHIIGNTVSLLLIGKLLEKRKGALRFILIYVIGGMGAGYVSTAYRFYISKDFDTIIVGASGAIFALLGALVMDVLTDEDMAGMRKRFTGFAVAMLIFNSIGLQIDWVGHIGGFLSGMLIMWYLNETDRIIRNVTYMRAYKRRVL